MPLFSRWQFIPPRTGNELGDNYAAWHNARNIDLPSGVTTERGKKHNSTRPYSRDWMGSILIMS